MTTPNDPRETWEDEQTCELLGCHPEYPDGTGEDEYDYSADESAT